MHTGHGEDIWNCESFARMASLAVSAITLSTDASTPLKIVGTSLPRGLRRSMNSRFGSPYSSVCRTYSGSLFHGVEGSNGIWSASWRKMRLLKIIMPIEP